MAKIPRYAAGRSNVGMLEKVPSSLQTPQAAAAAAAAPYQAAGDVIDVAGKTAIKVFELIDKTNKAEGKVDNAIEDGYYENALKNSKADNEQRSINDPDWTMQLYIDDINAVHQAREIGISKLKDEETRKQTTTFFNLNKNLINTNVLLDAASLNATRIRTNFNVAYNQSIEDENYAMSSHLIQVGLDATDDVPILGKIEGQELQHSLDALVKDQELSAIAKDIQMLFMEDSVRGMAEYKKILEDTSRDSKDNQILQGKVAGAINHGIKLKAFEKGEIADQYNNIKNEDILDIQMSPDPKLKSPTDIVNKYKNDGYGDTTNPDSFARVQAVLSEFESKMRADKTKTDFVAMMDSKLAIQDTQKNREQLDEYIKGKTTDDMTDEKKGEIIWNAVNRAGFPTQQHRNELKSGPRSAADMNKQLDLFKAYTSGDKKFDLGLTDTEYSDYLYIELLTEYDPSNKQNAIETWQQARTNNLTATSDVWNEEVYDGKTGHDLLKASFDEAIKSEQFEEDWLWGYGPDSNYRNDIVKRELFNKYMFIGKSQLGLGATPDMAAHNANKFMQQMGRTTDINGTKETQMNLPPGTEDLSMSHMKDEYFKIGLSSGFTTIDGAKTKVQHYQTVKGSVAVDDLDSAKVKLYVPLDKKKSRDEDGDTVFEVYYDGNPLSAVTEKGIQPSMVSFSKDDFISQESRQNERSDLADDADRLQNEINDLVKEQAARVGHDKTSGLFIYGTPDIDVKIQDLEDARENLEALGSGGAW